VSANSTIDWVIGVGWGLSPHASSLNLLLQRKLQSALNFGQNVSWKLPTVCWKSYLLIC